MNASITRKINYEGGETAAETGGQMLVAHSFGVVVSSSSNYEKRMVRRLLNRGLNLLLPDRMTETMRP